MIVGVKLSVDLEQWTFKVHMLDQKDVEVATSEFPIPTAFKVQALGIGFERMEFELGTNYIELPPALFRALDEEIMKEAEKLRGS
jgi:hypothetical protein